MLGDKGWERSDVSENALSVHRADYSIDLARGNSSAHSEPEHLRLFDG